MVFQIFQNPTDLVLLAEALGNNAPVPAFAIIYGPREAPTRVETWSCPRPTGRQLNNPDEVYYPIGAA